LGIGVVMFAIAASSPLNRGKASRKGGVQSSSSSLPVLTQRLRD
jgi:hypothetical protein